MPHTKKWHIIHPCPPPSLDNMLVEWKGCSFYSALDVNGVTVQLPQRVYKVVERLKYSSRTTHHSMVEVFDFDDDFLSQLNLPTI